MNKKLLTAAIGAALAAGPMLASSTAQADVKVYGRIHVSVDYLDPKGAGDTSGVTQSTSRKQTNVSSNASRWGIDVSEKLGGGLTAIGKLETEIRAGGDSNSQDARNRFVGLKGGFGSIIAGINDTPFKDIRSKLDFFGDQIGDARSLISGNGTSTNGTAGWDLRTPNAIKYTTPNFSGFEAAYQYSADRTANTGTEDNRRRADTIALSYSKGPLYVAYANESHRFNTIADGGKPTETANRLGASYSFGAFKLAGVWQEASDLGGTASGATNVKQKSWMLGGAYTAGNNVFKVQYVKLDDVSATSAGASGTGTGAKMWAIGWDHLFSKTTKAYVAYAKTDNDSLSNRAVNGPSAGGHSGFVAPAVGQDPQAWSVGMILDF